jgi:D-lactate dehydrogenase
VCTPLLLTPAAFMHAGTGKIGTITAGILGRGFGAKLLAFDAYPNPEFIAMGGEYVSLETLLEQSDIVSLHCPLNKSTFHLIGAPQIERMKRGAVLINTSRGGLMDTRAVIDGLESGAIGGLGMDVYEKEGPLFFRDFSSMNRAERMKGWDEQMGVRLRLRRAGMLVQRLEPCARARVLFYHSHLH